MDFKHINRMGGQELNILAAEEIMGWRMEADFWLATGNAPGNATGNALDDALGDALGDATGDATGSAPGNAPARRVADWYPSADPDQAEELLRALESLGLAEACALALGRVLALAPPLPTPKDLLLLARAEPKALCKAAVMAVLGKV